MLTRLTNYQHRVRDSMTDYCGYMLVWRISTLLCSTLCTRPFKCKTAAWFENWDFFPSNESAEFLVRLKELQNHSFSVSRKLVLCGQNSWHVYIPECVTIPPGPACFGLKGLLKRNSGNVTAQWHKPRRLSLIFFLSSNPQFSLSTWLQPHFSLGDLSL